MTSINFANFPVLKTERLILRQLSMDDHQGIFDLRSYPEINKYLGRKPCETMEDALNFISKVNDNIKKNMAAYWAITLKDNNTLVGTICLYDFSSEDNSCEIGYELMTKFQGNGIMKEAVQIVINYAFQTLKLKKLLACTHQDNQQSSKLLSKFNFLKSEETNKENPELVLYTLEQ